MHIHGRRLKKGREPIKGVLNEFSDSRVITFTEQEVGDVVDVEYRLNENEKGYFSEEYRADTISKEDAKAVDITAFIINEKEGMCYWWLYDLKKDVGGQDVIWHMCQQWRAAYQYLNNSVLSYLSDISVETRGNIGVVTRNFDVGRIRTEYNELDNAIREIEMGASRTAVLAKRKASVKLPQLRAKRDLLKDILNRKVSFRFAGKDEEFTFDVKFFAEREKESYYYRLICSLLSFHENF